MRRPEVSVVVPSFNSVAFIEETIESILAQTFEDFELIISDHASTDGTWEVLQRFADDQRVTLVQTPAGGGARANWNAVSRMASGRWIKLVPGDDLLRPRSLEACLDAVDAAGGSDPVLVATQRDLIDASGRLVIKGRGLGELSGVVEGPAALKACVRAGTNLLGEPGCVMIRRSAFEQVGWWQDLHYYIDLGSWAHVLARGPMVAVRESLAAFRMSGTQWSVRLAHRQATEAAEFHRLAQGLVPEAITDADVRLGDRRARWLSYQRRLLYLLLRRRMRVGS